MTSFLETHPNSENYWRGIVLLGRNVATYKLALAKSLLELSLDGKTTVSLEELAVPYTRHLTEHLKKSDKQITSSSSSFLEMCRQFNRGELNQTGLVDAAVKLGFKNVIDAFHVVNTGPVPVRFFVDERRSNKGITITDELLSLAGAGQAVNLPIEIEARWRLLETAWSIGLPPQLIAVQYDDSLESLFVEIPNGRIDVTGCRDALNGYQKGRCFYCFNAITVAPGPERNVDVDHFLPIVLKQYPEFAQVNLNGVWNLVLACEACNRGGHGKFMRCPVLRYLERLHTRNQFYIESHHPLRETLMNQSGQLENERRAFLQTMHRAARLRLIQEWKSPHETAPLY